MAQPTSASEIALRVGCNLKLLRDHARWSLRTLAQRSGVSRAMLGQIELGQSAPTITVLWRIAQALDVPVERFLQGNRASDG